MGEPPQVEESSEEFGAGSMAAPASTGKTQESIVKQFAMLLGTRSASPTQALPSAKTKDMMALISPTVSNQDVVLILPTLDLRVEEDPLPKVGEHRPQTVTGSLGRKPSVPAESRPMMETSGYLCSSESGRSVNQGAEGSSDSERRNSVDKIDVSLCIRISVDKPCKLV
jgi:hypothetical protein